MSLHALPDTMLAAQIVEFNKPYKIHRIPTPKELGNYDILLKTAVASYCHTDTMVIEGIMGTKLPCVGSHEGAGTVVAVGLEVTAFKKGDRVMAHLIRNTCGTCCDCLGPENYRQYCKFVRDSIGISKNGAFAEYFVADSRWSVKLPASVSFKTAAPLACAGSTAFRAVGLTDLKKGQWLAIVGSGGGLGHLATKFAKILGLRVIGIDARDLGLELSRACGADVVVDARLGNEKVLEEVARATEANGADATINLSDAPSAAATACAVTKRHGLMLQVAQVGLCKARYAVNRHFSEHESPKEVSIPFAEIIFRDIKIQGSVISSPKDFREMIAVVEKNNIFVTTTTFDGLDKIPLLFEAFHEGKVSGKAIVVVDQEQLDMEVKARL